MEYIEPSEFNKDLYKTQIMRDEMRIKNHKINQKLMDALAEARKEKGLDIDQLPQEFDPDFFVD
jgi:hypothetical protein